MYMQADRPIPPKNYSGSVFAVHAPEPPLPQEEPPAAAPPAAAPPTAAPHAEAEEVRETAAPTNEESAPAACGGRVGILSKFPLLSSLLPPPRRGETEARRLPLPDWALLGAVVLLFLSDEGNDILPFLLLLLLWD